MALKKSEKRLLIILGIAAAVFLVDKFIIEKKKKDAPAPQAQQNAPVPQAEIALKTPPKSSSIRTVYNGWGKDPFYLPQKDHTGSSAGAAAVKAPQKSEIKTAPLPELKGMFWKEGKTYVLIGDAVIAEGEENEGLKIEKVEGKTVFCRQGNRSFTLFWSESL